MSIDYVNGFFTGLTRQPKDIQTLTISFGKVKYSYTYTLPYNVFKSRTIYTLEEEPNTLSSEFLFENKRILLLVVEDSPIAFSSEDAICNTFKDLWICLDKYRFLPRERIVTQVKVV